MPKDSFANHSSIKWRTPFLGIFTDINEIGILLFMAVIFLFLFLSGFILIIKSRLRVEKLVCACVYMLNRNLVNYDKV